MVKKTLLLLLAAVAAFAVGAAVAAGFTAASEPEITAGEALRALQANARYVSEVVVYDAGNDPNGLMGRPGNYIGKGDFFDSRLEETGEPAGTIEFFSSRSDCDDRYKYLCLLSDPALGAFGTNQYIYRYDRAVFRVSFELAPGQAAEYRSLMDEIMGETSRQYGG